MAVHIEGLEDEGNRHPESREQLGTVQRHRRSRRSARRAQSCRAVGQQVELPRPVACLWPWVPEGSVAFAEGGGMTPLRQLIPVGSHVVVVATLEPAALSAPASAVAASAAGAAPAVPAIIFVTGTSVSVIPL